MGMEFLEKRAKELYESSSGLSKPADQFGYGHPFLSYSDVFHNYYAPAELTTLVNSTEKDRKSCSVKRGDVFLTRTSETTEELGMSCVALKDYPDATFNGFTKRLRPITDEIVPEYAAYFFRSAFFRAQCMSMASLITRASLNDGMIGRFRIRYPKSKTVQGAIGAALMNYDDLIEVNNKRIKVQEQMAENLYKEWFVRFRFPGHETAEFENGIPKGWEKKRISQLVIFLNGFAFKSEDYVDTGKYCIITIKNVQDGFLDLSDVERIDTIPNGMPSHCILKKGDVLMSLTGNVARVCIETDDNCLLNQRVCKIASKYPYYSYCFFKQEAIFQTLCNIAYGTAQLNLSPILAGRIKVFSPPDNLMKHYNNTVSPLFEEKQKLIEQNSILVHQRDRLLPRLMSGKIEV